MLCVTDYKRGFHEARELRMNDKVHLKIKCLALDDVTVLDKLSQKRFPGQSLKLIRGSLWGC